MIEQLLQALQDYFSGFGMPAFPEDSVPEYDEAGQRIRPPYITVQLACPAWRDSTPFHVRVWDRANNYKTVSAAVDAISAAIGEGESLPCQGGAAYVFKGRPFCQFTPFRGDPTLKCALLNLNLMAHIHE